MTIIGETKVRPEELTAAVAWVAKWITAKPIVPIQAGIAIDVDGEQVTLTAYSENATARAVVRAEGSGTGRAVVSGRLLAALAATFGKRDPVTISGDDGGVHLSAGKWKGRMPVMAEQDWPTLAGALPEIGRCAGDELAAAVERVGVARGTDEKAGTVFLLMHVGFTADGRMEFGATDRYRVAMTSIGVELAGNLPFDRLTPFAENMTEAAGAFAGAEHVTIGADPGSMSLTSDKRQVVMRLGAVDGGWPVDIMRGYLARGMEQTGEIQLTPDEIAMPLRRAGITGGKAGLARVRIGAAVMAVGGADSESGSDGDDEIEVDYDGEAAEGHFNAKYLGDAFTSAPGKTVRIKFTPGQMTMPIAASCDDDPHWRYITMPVRKLG